MKLFYAFSSCIYKYIFDIIKNVMRWIFLALKIHMHPPFLGKD